MPFRPPIPPVATGPTITLIRGTPVPDHATGGYAPNANRTHDGLFLLIQPASASEALLWLSDETPVGWMIVSTPPGLMFLPPDFDDSDLEFAGYARIGEIHA